MASASARRTAALAPNPARFEILRAEQRGTSLVAEVRYPGCTTYEGRKILVFENMKRAALTRRKRLDPHISDRRKSPFARFEPTANGWLRALWLASELSQAARLKVAPPDPFATKIAE